MLRFMTSDKNGDRRNGFRPAVFIPAEPLPPADCPAPRNARPSNRRSLARRVRDEVLVWVRTLMSAAVYATVIVTFGFQIARVDGESMLPTLSDHDRLVVNKLIYQWADPQYGDV